MKCPPAPFHADFSLLLQDWNVKFLEILGFRGCAKSSFAVLAFPIWAMLNNLSHYTLLLADTFPQAKTHIQNLRDELESNKLLIQDFGPFETQDDEWTKTDIIVRRYNSRISARSSGQKVRGIIHKQWRPQLIIGDDLENQKSVRTKEQRDKTYRWFIGEALQAGDVGTKAVLTGNLLHTDSLMSRVKQEIDDGRRDGVVREYPLLKDGVIQWLGKYPDMAAVEKKRREMVDHTIWLREFLLKVVPEDGQEVKDEWIRYYDSLPADGEVNAKGVGVDLAISKSETADYTSMVTAVSAYLDGSIKIFIRAYPVNERLSHFETIERAKALHIAEGSSAQFFVEEVGYQKAAIEGMERAFIPVHPMKPGGRDKRARLRSVAMYIQNGTILFPKTGCEDLIIQMTHFGVETHDDLVDAFVYAILGLVEYGLQRPEVYWI